MKRLVSPVILIVGLLLVGFPGRAMAQTGTETSAVTVTVDEYIAIEDLAAINFTITFFGAPAEGSGSGTDAFTVEANVATTINAAITTSPATLLTPYMVAPTLSTASGSVGSTPVTLTASASAVPLTVVADDYVEQITVTAVVTP